METNSNWTERLKVADELTGHARAIYARNPAIVLAGVAAAGFIVGVLAHGLLQHQLEEQI